MVLGLLIPAVTLYAWRDSIARDEPIWPPGDAELARSLYTTWAVRTGRALRAVPVTELTADELIDFWSDDQLERQPGNDHGQLS